MKTTIYALIFSLFFSSLSFAATPIGFSPITAQKLTEESVKFTYSSMDGEIVLECAHVFDKPDLWDWDVWCGKGTNMLRQFRVHLLIRPWVNTEKQKTAFEVLYWVIDRDTNPRKFSSTSSWTILNTLTSLETMSFSQGVENDYAFLQVEFTPKK